MLTALRRLKISLRIQLIERLFCRIKRMVFGSSALIMQPMIAASHTVLTTNMTTFSATYATVSFLNDRILSLDIDKIDVPIWSSSFILDWDHFIAYIHME